MPHWDLIVLSHVQTKALLVAHAKGEATAITSLDLNLTTTRVALSAEGVHFTPTERLAWEDVAFINDDENSCFHIR